MTASAEGGATDLDLQHMCWRIHIFESTSNLGIGKTWVVICFLLWVGTLTVLRRLQYIIAYTGVGFRKELLCSQPSTNYLSARKLTTPHANNTKPTLLLMPKRLKDQWIT